MGTIWFSLVALMLAGYVVLDGFDLGAGALHLIAARTDAERRAVLESIGPVWDGNEVWLLAAGGTLFYAFPLLYASSFSGFYLALNIVLWLLVFRALGIEFRMHLAHPLWCAFFDAAFSAASILLIVFFGAALGNVLRGVPLGGDHYFFAPLWTDFRHRREPRHPGLVYGPLRRAGPGGRRRAWRAVSDSENRRRPQCPPASLGEAPLAGAGGAFRNRAGRHDLRPAPASG